MFRALRNLMAYINGKDKFYRWNHPDEPRDPESVVVPATRATRMVCGLCHEDPCDPACPTIRADNPCSMLNYQDGRRHALRELPIAAWQADDPSYQLGRRIGDKLRLRDEGPTEAEMLARRLQATN